MLKRNSSSTHPGGLQLRSEAGCDLECEEPQTSSATVHAKPINPPRYRFIAPAGYRPKHGLRERPANARVDRMLHMIDAVPYAKQPIVERASGTIFGYTGADSLRLDGIDRLVLCRPPGRRPERTFAPRAIGRSSCRYVGRWNVGERANTVGVMSLARALAQSPGVYYGTGDGPEGGPFVSRIELTPLPNGGV